MIEGDIGQRQPIRATARTIWWLLLPWRFWRVAPTYRPTRGRPVLLSMLLLTVLACGLGFAAYLGAVTKAHFDAVREHDRLCQARFDHNAEVIAATESTLKARPTDELMPPDIRKFYVGSLENAKDWNDSIDQWSTLDGSLWYALKTAVVAPNTQTPAILSKAGFRGIEWRYPVPADVRNYHGISVAHFVKSTTLRTAALTLLGIHLLALIIIQFRAPPAELEHGPIRNRLFQGLTYLLIMAGVVAVVAMLALNFTVLWTNQLEDDWALMMANRTATAAFSWTFFTGVGLFMVGLPWSVAYWQFAWRTSRL